MSTYNSMPNPKVNNLIESFPAVKAVFDVLVSLFNNHEKVYISIAKLAKITKYCPRHVIRALEVIEESGAITRKKNGYLESNDYILNDLFYIPEIREQLAKFFHNFATWGMSSLMRASQHFNKNVTLLYCNYNYKNINEDWSAQDDIEIIKNHKKENQTCEQDESTPISSTNCKEKTYKKQMFRAGQFTPGFNSNYYFTRSDRDFDLERAEYYQAVGFIARNDKVGLSVVHDLQAKQVLDRQRKQDEERQKSMEDKKYTQDQLAKNKEINENNKRKGGTAAFFANFLEEIKQPCRM